MHERHVSSRELGARAKQRRRRERRGSVLSAHPAPAARATFQASLVVCSSLWLLLALACSGESNSVIADDPQSPNGSGGTEATG
ncbi:MAG TPA: hypothetical protein VMG12_34635, partial [Polyangiaceae bacterium]|nr:hypothetical protein [Polyangiaceae bacterium]